MPNHVHVIVEPKKDWAIGKIKHGWTSFTANVINRKVGRCGTLWQHEPYDHIIRSAKEYVFQVLYVWNNPEKAGITASRWRKGWA
jgi:REP element-mobilizing transposase RayT